MIEQAYLFLDHMFNGLTVGSAYALIAIGYTMVYGIIGMINFAHGEVYMMSAYLGFMVIGGLTMLGIDSGILLIAGAMIVSVVISSVYGFSIERVAYRPVRNQNRLIALITAIGMSIFLQNYILLGQSSRNISMQPLISGNWSLMSPGGFEASLSYMQAAIWVVTIIAMISLTLFVNKTRLGRACRATSEDLTMTSLLGINTNNVISITFVIGAAMAAIAGVMLGTYYGDISPYMGFIMGLKAFTAAVLGGIGSIPGAMLGGIILGMTEAMAAGYFSAEYKDVVSFGLLILVLLFRPYGLLGKPEVEKV